MKRDSREEHEYPDLIQAEAKGGKIVEYLRLDVVRDREQGLLSQIHDLEEQIRKNK